MLRKSGSKVFQKFSPQTYPQTQNLPHTALTPAHGRAGDHGFSREQEGGPAVLRLTTSQSRAVIARLLTRNPGDQKPPPRQRFSPAHATGRSGNQQSFPPARHYDRARSDPIRCGRTRAQRRRGSNDRKAAAKGAARRSSNYPCARRRPLPPPKGTPTEPNPQAFRGIANACLHNGVFQ